MVVAVILLAFSAAQWWYNRSHLADLQQELSRGLAATNQAAQEVRGSARADHELLQEVHGRIGVLEAKLAESQNRAIALESIYQDLLRSRDERLLTEIEQTLTIAAQQIQLAGNVEAALIALQGADARLATAAQPRFVPLRRLIERDIERLKTLPASDITGIAVKIENVVATVDSLSLAFEQRPPATASSSGKKSSGAPIKPAELAPPLAYWRALGEEIWRELRQLVRIQRIDQNDPALLAPTQTYFLRENLKLRLLSARLALLQRDGKTYREELRQARLVLEKYFDTSAKPVQIALATISRVAEIDLALDLPGLGATLTAVRNFKQTRSTAN
jgi:uroporphyrin-3 C-methyltransferase